MSLPTLGELAVQARVFGSRGQLDETLRIQRQNYLEGDFRRLGELMVDHGRCPRSLIRRLLGQQGIAVVECQLCESRYNAFLFQGTGRCLRCGRQLRMSHPEAPLTVEDSISGGSPKADRMLREHMQRNPRLGRYQILGELGRGGMGVIYKAWETDLQRHVALKFLRPYGDVSPEAQERFRREARAVAALRHENIVQAHAIEEASGLVYLSMDFVEGAPLDVLASQRTMSWDHIIMVCVKVPGALHYAHEHGIVHRDVKPANIVIDRKGQPALVDFGIAKSDTELSVTGEGEILGSLAYMAPEYVRRGKEALDRRCDVYGLGVVLYETLTEGRLPFGEADDEELILRIVKEDPVPVRKAYAGIPDKLARVIDKAVAKDLGERYPTCEALARDLEAYLQERSGRLQREQLQSAPARPGQRRRKSVFERASETMEDLSAIAPRQAAVPRGLYAAVGVLAVAVLFLGISWAITTQRQGQAVDQLRRDSGQAFLQAAESLAEARDWHAALDACDRAVLLLPADPESLRLRSRVRRELGNRLGAEEDREAADALERGSN